MYGRSGTTQGRATPVCQKVYYLTNPFPTMGKCKNGPRQVMSCNYHRISTMTYVLKNVTPSLSQSHFFTFMSEQSSSTLHLAYLTFVLLTVHGASTYWMQIGLKYQPFHYLEVTSVYSVDSHPPIVKSSAWNEFLSLISQNCHLPFVLDLNFDCRGQK